MINVAIIGRPNVGKSTLFNQLTGTRDALVHDRPGVTRDAITGTGDWGFGPFQITDTAGLDNARGELTRAMTDTALAALNSADAILFVVDGRAGLNADDLEWAKIVRRAKKPILLVGNKAESQKRIGDLSDFYKLGMGAPALVSAEHKTGFDAIFDFIAKLPKDQMTKRPNDHKPLRITIMGQPNVGKSTFVNTILGEQRMIVRDEPGITRDTVAVKTKYMGRDIVLSDTAGLRRKSNVTDDVETLSALKALDALDKTDAVILVVDATRDIENQTLGIAARVYGAGKIMAVALNKWDLVPEPARADVLLKLKHQFKNSFHQITNPLILAMSATTGSGVRNLMKRVFEIWDKSEMRAPTSLINGIIEKLVERRQPPMSRLKRPMKIKFAHQTKTHPATIVIHVGGASDIPESYTRYLRKGIAAELGWEQIPVVIEYKKSGNPYS